MIIIMIIIIRHQNKNKNKPKFKFLKLDPNRSCGSKSILLVGFFDSQNPNLASGLKWKKLNWIRLIAFVLMNFPQYETITHSVWLNHPTAASNQKKDRELNLTLSEFAKKQGFFGPRKLARGAFPGNVDPISDFDRLSSWALRSYLSSSMVFHLALFLALLLLWSNQLNLAVVVRCKWVVKEL